MKRVLIFFLFTALILCLLPAAALADAVNYEDPSFHNLYDGSEYEQLKTFLNAPSAFAGDSNGERICGSVYSEQEPYNWHGVTWTAYTEGPDTVYHVTGIDWMTSGSYYQVDGNLDLSDFPYLASFQLDYAQIDALDVTGDTNLATLVCTRTKMTDADGAVTHTGITSLDLSTNAKLSTLNVNDNSIVSLNTSAAGTTLIQLHCKNNALISLNVSGNTNLTTLVCSNNKLTGTLDLTNYSLLGTLICDHNSYKVLVMDGCVSLIHLECENNDITGSLDLTDSTELLILKCQENQLTGLAVGGSTKLISLDCSNNRLPTLGLPSSTAMNTLDCSGNRIASLNVADNTALTSLSCQDNLLSSLNVSLNTKLTTLYCQNNPIKTLSTSSNTALVTLDCSGDGLTALNVSANTALQILRCADNNLGSLNVSANTALTDLECGNCGLSSLDVDGNKELDILYCDRNPLGTLDLSASSKLTTLDCSRCGLSALDVSATNLSGLNCAYNNLTSLNIGSIAGFFLLDVSGNKLTDLDLSAMAFVFDCTDNPLSHVKTTLVYGYTPEDSRPVELTANGEGYVGMYANMIFPDAKFNNTTYNQEAFALGKPKTGAAFYRWTDATDAQVSTSAKYTLNTATAYDLTANFLSLTSSAAGGTIYVGGRITLNPGIEGGTWSFDKSMLSRSGDVFTGLKTGTAHVVYTLGAASVSYDIVVQAASLPSTGQDMTPVYILAALGVLALSAGIILGVRRRAHSKQ